MSVRTAFYRLEWSTVADWVILSRSGDQAHVYSNTLNTDVHVPFVSLIAADRDMTSPMFLAVADPEPRTATGSASSAAGFIGGPAASSAPRTTSPGTGGQPLARTSDPQTAHDAANVAKSAAAHNRIKALHAHAAAGEHGLTGDELELATGLPYEVIGPRRPALEAEGLIVKAGVTRPNRRGNAQQVYVITEAGRAVADRAVA